MRRPIKSLVLSHNHWLTFLQIVLQHDPIEEDNLRQEKNKYQVSDWSHKCTNSRKYYLIYSPKMI